MPFVLRDFGVIGARVRETGGALCRPLSSVPVAVRGGNHGVSDPAARARRGPAPVRRGRSRHGRLSLQVVVHSMFGGEKRRLSSASNALDCDSDRPEDPVRFVRTMLPANWSRSRVLPWQVLFRKIVARASYSMSTGSRHDVSTSGVASTLSAITTTMLHLCSAPCKALRFAPPARTRGLRALTVPARR